MTALAGTLQLTRFELRRDRIVIAVWLGLLLAVVYASAAATPSLYPTEAERVAAARLINASPAAVALYGPILDTSSLGEVAMTKLTVLYAVFVMALSLVLVRRHTRTEEETGRQELVAATVVGRSAPLVSALVESLAVVTLLAVLVAACLVGGGLPVAGSLVFAGCWWGSGVVGIGIAAVAVQLSASARTCALVGATAVGAVYLLRVVGDLGPDWVGWLSPLGWNTRLRAWSDPRWWVLGLYPVLAGGLVAWALMLRGRRDLGSGLVAERPGPATGDRTLKDALGLTLRLQRSALAAWTVVAIVMGAVFGSLVPNLGSLFESETGREMLRRLGGAGSVEDAMLAGVMSVVALVLTAFAVSVVARGGSDESDGRTEQVLATATPRAWSFAAVLVVALVGATWLLLATGVAAGLGYGAQREVGETLDRSVGSTMVVAPAMWLVTALAMLGLALGSRWAIAGWVLLVAFATVGLVGELLRLPDWVVDLSPYQHVAKYPSEPVSWRAEIVLAALAAVTAVVAWWAYRRRDIG